MTIRPFERSRLPLATSRAPIQPPQPDAAVIEWRDAQHADQVRVVGSAAPGPDEEYELCRSGVGDEARYRIRHRTYDGSELATFRETEPAGAAEVHALWDDLLEGKAR